VYGSSAAATEHLLRTPRVAVFVDGYNVAKLRWPRLTLDEQRARCIETAEDVARRYGTNVTVVFDGADIPGAVASKRRLVRRWSWSPTTRRW
jgi:predicted RNA-binding protein with PIN domain